MRVLVVPLLAFGVMLNSYSGEPTTQQMRSAFERSLTAQVDEALTFVSETGGTKALEQVRAAGNDRFTIRSFRKLDCRPAYSNTSYDCAFGVEIELATGVVHSTVKGRFFGAGRGLTFTPQA
jgi:hypothetical protein